MADKAVIYIHGQGGIRSSGMCRHMSCMAKRIISNHSGQLRSLLKLSMQILPSCPAVSTGSIQMNKTNSDGTGLKEANDI